MLGRAHSGRAIARVPMYLAWFLPCRGVPALLFRRRLGTRPTVALALLSATSLSFVLTATDIGVRIGKLRDINATALVGAAVLEMLIFPLGAQSLLARPDEPAAATPDPLPPTGLRPLGPEQPEQPGRRQATTAGTATAGPASRGCSWTWW